MRDKPKERTGGRLHPICQSAIKPSFFGDVIGKDHVFAGYPFALDSLKCTPYVRIKLCTYKFLICILINNMVKLFPVQSLLCTRHDNFKYDFNDREILKFTQKTGTKI